MKLRLHTRWIYFLFTTMANVALVYAFVAPEFQKKALVLLASTVVVTGVYVLREQKKTSWTFWDSVRNARIPRWGAAAVAGDAATWEWEGHAVRLQRFPPKRGIGEIETVFAAEIRLAFPGKVLIYPQPLSSGNSRKLLKVLAEPADASDKFLDVGTWEAVGRLVSLLDPLHQLHVSFREGKVIVSLEGEIENAESVRLFLESSFKLADRAVEIGER